MTRRISFIALAVTLSLAASFPLPAATINFSDSFESPTFDPFWTLNQSYGTVSLSTAQSHSGTQSAAFASTTGGQRTMQLIHDFGQPLQGHISIWLYDAAPGSETLYEAMWVQSEDSSQGLLIGTMDYDAYCYVAIANGTGPNAPCGRYPQNSTTNISRTLGWHHMEADYGPSALTLTFDGQTVVNVPGNYSFNRVFLNMSGPYWRPDTASYWDDFQVSADPVPEPASLLLLTSGLLFLARLKLRRG
jgi:hypothetical protein